MAENPYSKYQGTRISPIPAGYLTAAGKMAETTRAGYAGLGKSIGAGIAKYYEDKEEERDEAGLGEAANMLTDRGEEGRITTDIGSVGPTGIVIPPGDESVPFPERLPAVEPEWDEGTVSRHDRPAPEVRDQMGEWLKKYGPGTEGEVSLKARREAIGMFLSEEDRRFKAGITERETAVKEKPTAGTTSATAEKMAFLTDIAGAMGWSKEELATRKAQVLGAFPGVGSVPDKLQIHEAIKEMSWYKNMNPDQRGIIDQRLLGVEEDSSTLPADEVKFNLIAKAMKGAKPEDVAAAQLHMLGGSPSEPKEIRLFEYMESKGLVDINTPEGKAKTDKLFGVGTSAYMEKVNYLKQHRPGSITEEQLYRANAGITQTALEAKVALLNHTKQNLPAGWTNDDAYRVVMLGKDVSNQTTITAFTTALTAAKTDDEKRAVHADFGVPTAQQVKLEKASLDLKEEQIKIAGQTLTDMKKKASTKEFWERVKDGENPFIDIEGVGRYVFSSTGGGYLEKDASTAGGSGGSGANSIIYTRWKSLSEAYHMLRKGAVPEVGQWNLKEGTFSPGKLDPIKLDDSNKRQLTMMGHFLAAMEQDLGQTPATYYDYTKMKWEGTADDGKWVSTSGGVLPIITPKPAGTPGGAIPAGGGAATPPAGGGTRIVPPPRSPLLPPRKKTP